MGLVVRTLVRHGPVLSMQIYANSVCVCVCVLCYQYIIALPLLSLYNSGLSNGARYQEFYPYKALEGPH